VAATTPCQNLGFLSVFQEIGAYVGGLLATNNWGRPLEFRLTSAVAPNKVQQILYGDTLGGYLCGEVIGKTLLDKTATPLRWVLVDNPLTLDLRLRVDCPVGLWHCVLHPDDAPPGVEVLPRVYCHAQFPDDAPILREAIEKLGAFDFAEPFARIREAMNEARKLGVSARGAAA